jgi:hypothetical protein
MPNIKKTGKLKNIPIFSGLTDNEISMLADIKIKMGQNPIL